MLRRPVQVSLVIPTWNAGPLLEEVLAAVDGQEGAGDLEKVAVDSGSTDGTVERLRAHGFAVHGIDQREFDHGATRDLAIGRTAGDVVLLLTQDATPEPGWLAELAALYREHPEVDAAWCRQDPRPDCNPLLRARIREWMGSREGLRFQRLEDGRKLEELPAMEQLRLCSFDNVASSVRRTAWEELRFGRRRFGEDIAFGRRLVAGGGTIAFAAEAGVVHSHDSTPGQEGQRLYRDHQNLVALFGLVQIPDLRHCRRAVREGRAHFLGMVEELEGVGDGERERLRRWARGYAFWSAWGQYLGANHARLRRSPMAPAIWLMERWA